MDTTPRYVHENTGQFANQRTVTVVGARETVGSQVVQQTVIQCFKCKEFRHFTKECRKPKRAKDYTYHKKKMLMCKQAKKGVPLQAEQADWLEDMDEEINKQELEAHYSFMAKILEVLPAKSESDAEPLEKIQKQLKKANTSLSHELQECKSTLEECKSSLDKSNRTRDRYLGALHDKEVELEKYKIFKDHTIKKDTLERKLKETLGLLAQKEHDIKEGLKIKAYEISVVKEKNDELVKQSLLTKASYEGLVKEKNKSIQTIHMLAPKSSTYNGRPTFANPMYLKKTQSEKPCLYEIPYDKDDLTNTFAPDREETLTLEQERSDQN
ncbi:retrovirus-related pol polyprotein from transposon TNT 1-94 [Tanacetum coccineum]